MSRRGPSVRNGFVLDFDAASKACAIAVVCVIGRSLDQKRLRGATLGRGSRGFGALQALKKGAAGRPNDPASAPPGASPPDTGRDNGAPSPPRGRTGPLLASGGPPCEKILRNRTATQSARGCDNR